MRWEGNIRECWYFHEKHLQHYMYHASGFIHTTPPFVVTVCVAFVCEP